MTMETRTRSLLSAAFVVLCAMLAATATFAHPPWNPYDDTRFAPITRFGPSVGIEVVAKGDATNTLTSPLKGVVAPGLPNHIFIVDQTGIVWAVNLTTKVRTKFLDVASLVIKLGVCGPDTFDERGLLGLAFHPNYQQNGKFYTYTSEPDGSGPVTIRSPVPFDPDHQNVVSEWVAVTPGNPAAGVHAGRRELMRLNWPQFNHNGGDLAFGPDGKLYISMGDGGGADDADGKLFILALPKHPQTSTCSVQALTTGHQDDGNAQKLNTYNGKIHRIDVNPPFTAGKQYSVPADNPFVSRPGALPEIWAHGVRNPWRFSFDSQTGELYEGDVGQNDIEEVNLIVRGGNFGWNFKEGTVFFHIVRGANPGFASVNPDPARGPIPEGLIDPIAQYDTHHEGHSVIGGYVYHGGGIPQLRGKYVFGDFALLFKFPRGPHDYARLFTMSAGRSDDGLRAISELMVLPGGKVSLALLGIGQDAQGEIYMMGNVSGLPFGNSGVVVKLVPLPDDGNGDENDN
jgi:glucose/arabinose dehydrogenase